MQTHRIKVLGQAGQDSGSRRSWPEKKGKRQKKQRNPASNKGRRQKQQPSCPESRTFGQVKVTCKVAGMSESRNVGGVENSSQPQLVRIIGDPGRVAAGVSGAMPFDHKRAKNLFGVVKCSIFKRTRPPPFPSRRAENVKSFSSISLSLFIRQSPLPS